MTDKYKYENLTWSEVNEAAEKGSFLSIRWARQSSTTRIRRLRWTRAVRGPSPTRPKNAARTGCLPCRQFTTAIRPACRVRRRY